MMIHNYLLINTGLLKRPKYFFHMFSDHLLDIYVTGCCLQSKQHDKFKRLLINLHVSVSQIDFYITAYSVMLQNKRKRTNPVVQNLGILRQLKQSSYIHNELDLHKVLSQQPITKVPKIPLQFYDAGLSLIISHLPIQLCLYSKILLFFLINVCNAHLQRTTIAIHLCR